MQENIMEEFWRNVEKTAECWNWLGSKDRDGYGRVRFDGRTHGAHNLSFKLHFGDVSDGLDVCHTCDNPGCVRPDHLWAGSRAQNMADCVEKGRLNRGKLSENDVLTIRERYSAGYRWQDLAVEYGVSATHMLRVVKGRRWKYLL